ncbi:MULTISPECIES: hypothetical protein [Polymorphospora]|uniref:ABC transporter permease n=1 Tax=Polymorphospora lycopeni TaxID=3140240 RepID=A0ABV5CJX6_9ACTN
MGRVLRIELRRSAAVGVALLALVIGAGLLVSYTEGFSGRWMQLAVSGRGMLLALWPLALAGGAWLGRRDARSRVGELFASTGRPRWQRVLPTAAALAVALVAAYTLIFVVGTVWVVPTAGYFPAASVAVTAVGALSLVAAGWVGMAVGRAVPRLVTAPALAVAGVAVAGLLPDWMTVNAVVADRPAPAALLLSPVYASGLDDFQTVTARVNLTQTLWLAALAATGLLLLGAARRRGVALAVLPAVLGGAVALPLMPTGGYRAYDPGAAELVCDDAGPQVCVARVHAALLPDVAGPARQALAMMSAKLPGAPTRAVEDRRVESWARSGADPAPDPRPADTLVFEAPVIGPSGRADLSGDYFLPHLLEAAWRQDCGDGPDDSDTRFGRVVATAWLTGEPPAPQDWWTPEERAGVAGAYQALVGLPPAEQQRRMVAARDDALACRDDGLRSLMGEDVP